MRLYDLANPTEEMNSVLSKNCPEDLFLRVMADFEDTNIISTIKFLSEEGKIYYNLDNHIIGIDWNIYNAPSFYKINKRKINKRDIADIRFEESSAFITIPFYLIPNEINYFEYWLENYFHFPINMEKLCIQFINLQENGMAARYELKNTILNKQNHHLFIGSFARVSNGWKFYPKMQFYKNIEIRGIAI